MRGAVVLSGNTVGLAVARALGVKGVPVTVVEYDPNDIAGRSRYATTAARSPDPQLEEAAFIDELLGLAPRSGGSMIIPASDETLAAVARHRAVLDRDFVVASPDWHTARLFIEKKHTYALAEKLGVAIPRTTIPVSEEDVERYGANADYPVFLKPSQSHLFDARFHTKMVRVEHPGQMMAAYRRATDAGLEVMLQEVVPGPESNNVNYNSYRWDGRPLVEFTARKLRNSPPRIGSPRAAVSERIDEIVEPGRTLLGAMNFCGFSNAEFKRDERDGVYKLLEVNGRHNLSSLLAVRCGINFPWLHYHHLIDGVLPSPQPFRTGVYWTDLLRDMARNIGCYAEERYPLADYARPYLGPHVDAILDWHDPMPFVKRCTGLAGTAASAMVERALRSGSLRRSPPA